MHAYPRVKLVAAIGACVLLLAATGCGGKSTVNSAEEELIISTTQLSLADWVNQGGPESKLVANTNSLLDEIHGHSTSYRRAQIDEALATVADSGCDVCVSALENARP